MSRMRILIYLMLIALFALPILAQEDDDGGKTLPGEEDSAADTTDSEDDDENDSENRDDDDDDEDDIDLEDMLEQGDVEITVGDILLEVDFSDEDDWENYEEETRFVLVDDDEYVGEVEENNFIWGQHDEVYEDVVIQVTARQDGGEDNNGYGVICRTEEDVNTFDGYHFLIDGLGNGAILRYDADEGYTALVTWEQFDEINVDDEPNIMHIVCVDEYLALYVNGELIAEAEDDEYDEGVVSFVVINFEDDGFARAIFDDLIVYEAED
ncbi:MAG: family 16 glycoside hydrolase [Chloroflexota bacterium]